MPELELEIESHEYTLNGVTIPGCTFILGAMGAAPTYGFLSKEDREYYSTRGTAGHRAVELLIREELDKRMSQELKKCLIGWERFVDDYGVEIIRINGQPFVEQIL